MGSSPKETGQQPRPALAQVVTSPQFLGVLASIIGIAGGLGTVAFFVVAASVGTVPPMYIRAIVALVAFGLVLLIAVVALTLIRARAELHSKVETERAHAWQEKFEQFHHVNLSVYEQIFQLLEIDYAYCTYLRTQYSADPTGLQQRFDAYIDEFLAHVAAIFTICSGNTCAASIKIFSTASNERIPINYDAGDSGQARSVVFTLGRDPASRHNRSLVDKRENRLFVYDYERNAAFYFITHHPERCTGYYCRDGLDRLPPLEYWNDNPNWQSLYNAVAVTSLKNPANETAAQALGFLCVDNKGGGLEEPFIKPLLGSLASILYYSIRMTLSLSASSKGAEA